jgi:hypothetical protein
MSNPDITTYIASLAAENASLREKNEKLVKEHAELSEIAKVAWRALCDAEAVLNTIDGDDVLESVNLEELQGRVAACAGNLFCVLGLPVAALAGAKP